MHREIDNVIKELKNEVDKIESKYFAVLDTKEGEIKDNISEITQIIADVKKLINSNNVSRVSSYTSKFAKFRRFPPKLKVALPSLSPQKINKQQIYQQFGSLSAVGITPQDYDYPSDSPRTLDEYTSYTVKTDTVIEKGTNRELDEIQVCHASADPCQAKEISTKRKQRIKSAEPQFQRWHEPNCTDSYPSRTPRGRGMNPTTYSTRYGPQPQHGYHNTWTTYETTTSVPVRGYAKSKKVLGRYNIGSREGGFQCPKCNQMFSDSRTLHTHLMDHLT